MMLDSRKAYTRHRRGAVTRTRGKAASPAAATLAFKGSQLQPDQVGALSKLLPEGERTAEYGVILTKTDLRAANQHTGTPADLIVDDAGVTWKVVQVMSYSGRGAVSHFKAKIRRHQEESA